MAVRRGVFVELSRHNWTHPRRLQATATRMRAPCVHGTDCDSMEDPGTRQLACSGTEPEKRNQSSLERFHPCCYRRPMSLTIFDAAMLSQTGLLLGKEDNAAVEVSGCGTEPRT